MKCGYARVSTDDQNPDLQLTALKRAGWNKTLVDEGRSGPTLNRPALKRCLKQLEHGDMLMVWKFDRLGRNACCGARGLRLFARPIAKEVVASGPSSS